MDGKEAWYSPAWHHNKPYRLKLKVLRRWWNFNVLPGESWNLLCMHEIGNTLPESTVCLEWNGTSAVWQTKQLIGWNYANRTSNWYCKLWAWNILNITKCMSNNSISLLINNFIKSHRKIFMINFCKSKLFTSHKSMKNIYTY